MKSLKILTICLFILISSCSQNQQKEKKVNYTSPETQLEKFSYSIGVNIATSMKEKHKLNEIDGQSVAKGFHDVVYDLPLDIKLLDTDSILNEYFYQLLEDQNYEQAAEALKLGEEFLEENAKRDKVKITETGLQYEILKLGLTGLKAKKENVVTIHYQASLINGDVYDSSINKEPVSFPLNAPNGTIKGLHEGIELMSVGDQYRFYIPAKLAYGNTSPEGSPIPAGSTLIFVVELVKLSDLQGNQL
ncbi:MAG: FKBP-type peptidyl-prolyl cis-trans isomerase [Flavobacteriales bacterium]